MKYKANERKAMCHYGTESFPDESERARQRNTVFDRMVKVSVLDAPVGTRRRISCGK